MVRRASPLASEVNRTNTVEAALLGGISYTNDVAGLDPRPQGRDPRPAERGRGQPAQPGVVGRVDAEHVPGEGGTGQALGDHRAVTGKCGVHVLGQAGVVERGLGLLVADDQPRAVPIGQRDLVHRAVRLDAGEQRVRVVSVVVAPRVECRVAHSDHP